MTLLSLCLIVRDEEEMLPGCLASVRGLVDEIVAADTGSSDDTAALLAGAGARVVDHPWRDDFAAARNATLAAARGEYVLVLDADERLAGPAASTLGTTVREGRIDCGLLPLHHASRLDASEADVLSGRARLIDPVPLPRFLRRTTDLAYAGIVHEDVSAWLARPGRVVRALDAPIVHLGAAPEWRAARGKRERNLRLLEERCRREPASPVPRAYLANELLRAGQRERGAKVLEDALSLLEAARARGEPLDPTHVLTLAAWNALRDGAPERAAHALARAREWGCEHANFDILRAAWLEQRSLQAEPEKRRELAEEGIRHVRRALARASHGSSVETLPGATGHAGETLLGHLELACGRPEEAHAAFGRALAERPEHVPARLGSAEARLELGDPAGAIQALQPLLGAGGPDAWFLAARACERLGAAEDARLFAATAVREAAKGAFQAPHRVPALRAWLARAGAGPEARCVAAS